MALLVSAVSLGDHEPRGFLLTPWLDRPGGADERRRDFVGLLLFWGWVWNVWGMLLAVPLLMVMKAVWRPREDLKGRRRAAWLSKGT